MPFDLSADRWSEARVLALASDAASQRAARGLTEPAVWRDAAVGVDETGRAAAWGLCQGSRAAPYEVWVRLDEPAFRCACPSRKAPCKHALGLLLRWAAGNLPGAPPPDRVAGWLAELPGRGTGRSRGGPPRDPVAAQRTVQRRAERVTAGLEELDRWLADQARAGLAGAARAGYQHWDTMAARLVDAQAPGAAGAVRRLAAVAVAEPPDRLLGELGLLRLLVAGHRRLPDLPAGLAAAVRARVGYPVATQDVLAGPPVRDRWAVIGVRDEGDEQLSVRRVWLLGSARRPALVLSFAHGGQALPADLLPGTTVDADLAFYPGDRSLRALVADRYDTADGIAAPGEPVAAALSGYAVALAGDPWLERWPVLLDGVVPTLGGGRWHVVDAAGAGLPLRRDADPWPLVAAAGGGPLALAGEWSTGGLLPLTAWISGRMVAL
jgi:hypothetical protein